MIIVKRKHCVVEYITRLIQRRGENNAKVFLVFMCYLKPSQHFHAQSQQWKHHFLQKVIESLLLETYKFSTFWKPEVTKGFLILKELQNLWAFSNNLQKFLSE